MEGIYNLEQNCKNVKPKKKKTVKTIITENKNTGSDLSL